MPILSQTLQQQSTMGNKRLRQVSRVLTSLAANLVQLEQPKAVLDLLVRITNNLGTCCGKGQSHHQFLILSNLEHLEMAVFRCLSSVGFCKAYLLSPALLGLRAKNFATLRGNGDLCHQFQMLRYAERVRLAVFGCLRLIQLNLHLHIYPVFRISTTSKFATSRGNSSSTQNI